MMRSRDYSRSKEIGYRGVMDLVSRSEGQVA